MADAIYPDDPPTVIKQIADTENQGYRLSYIQMSLHSGTHIDFPAHFVRAGKSANDYDINAFFLDAVVVYQQQALSIISNLQLGSALLVKTKQAGQSTEKSSLSPELADHCVKKGLALVGIDQLSVDKHTADDFVVHRILLEAGVLILENLDLSKVDPGRYQLVCLPILTGRTEAAPVRAVLINRCGGKTGAV